MTDKPSGARATTTFADDVSPDSLMNEFRGRPIGVILAFTIIVHIVFVGVFSIGYLKNAVFGEDNASISEKERLDMAMREATTSLRKIAERHGLSPQDLSERFANGDSKPGTTANPQPANSEVQANAPVSETPASEEPKSAIEKDLQKKAFGPDLPDLPTLEEEEDLFK